MDKSNTTVKGNLTLVGSTNPIGSEFVKDPNKNLRKILSSRLL